MKKAAPQPTFTQPNDYISAKTLEIIKIIESTDDESARKKCIENLAATQDTEVSRVLLDLWDRTLWREVKKTIIHAIGLAKQERGTEFLISFAKTSDDLPLVREAILALGKTDSPIAGEFLRSFLKDGVLALRKETFLALTSFSYFSCPQEIAKVIDDESILHLHTIIHATTNLCYSHFASEMILTKLHKVYENSKLEPVKSSLLLTMANIGNEKTLGMLKVFDDSKNFLLAQLKENATTQIEKRLKQKPNPEETLTKLLEIQDDKGTLDLIKDYAPATIRNIIDKNKVKESTECILRAVSPSHKTGESDSEFILQNWQIIDDKLLAFLISSYRSIGQNILPQIYKTMPFWGIIKISSKVRDTDLLDRFKDAFKESTELAIDEQIHIVNALVYQAQMVQISDSYHQRIGKFLYESFLQVKEPNILKRLIRALGQTHFQSKGLLEKIGALLSHENDLAASIYFTLAKIANSKSKEIVLNRLEKLLSQPQSSTVEIKQNLKALTKMGALPRTNVFSKLPKADQDIQPLLLKILECNKIANHDDIVENYLANPAFGARIQAIAAAKYNSNTVIGKKLFSLLDDKNACIRGRALDSLCIGGDHKEQEQIFTWLKKNHYLKGDCLKVFGSLVPNAALNYLEIIKILDDILQNPKGSLQEPEIWQAAINFRDNLETSFGQRQGEGSAQVDDDLDKSLSFELPQFNSLSSSVKTVLRNAELTWQNPKLFDHRVDKSTIIVELTKSIDMILQESIGANLFIRARVNLLSQMQSNIMRLELGDERRDVQQILRDLQCDQAFDKETFPLHKLFHICESIMSGNIVYNQYKILDGLRAWSLMLLLFGRDLTYKKEKIPALLNLTASKKDSIEDICQAMNRLQNLRNRAAHRETFLDKKQLLEVRSSSFWLINHLLDILPKKSD